MQFIISFKQQKNCFLKVNHNSDNSTKNDSNSTKNDSNSTTNDVKERKENLKSLHTLLKVSFFQAFQREIEYKILEF